MALDRLQTSLFQEINMELCSLPTREVSAPGGCTARARDLNDRRAARQLLAAKGVVMPVDHEIWSRVAEGCERAVERVCVFETPGKFEASCWIWKDRVVEHQEAPALRGGVPESGAHRLKLGAPEASGRHQVRRRDRAAQANDEPTGKLTTHWIAAPRYAERELIGEPRSEGLLEATCSDRIFFIIVVVPGDKRERLWRKAPLQKRPDALKFSWEREVDEIASAEAMIWHRGDHSVKERLKHLDPIVTRATEREVHSPRGPLPEEVYRLRPLKGEDMGVGEVSDPEHAHLPLSQRSV